MFEDSLSNKCARSQEQDVDLVLDGREEDSDGVAEENGLVETGVIAGNAKDCLKKRRKGAFFYLPFSVFLEQKAFQIEIEHIRNTETAFWNGLLRS